jgi:hypothetical protein
MNVAADVARDHSRITPDFETVVVIPGDILGFSHHDWNDIGMRGPRSDGLAV